MMCRGLCWRERRGNDIGRLLSLEAVRLIVSYRFESR